MWVPITSEAGCKLLHSVYFLLGKPGLASCSFYSFCSSLLAASCGLQTIKISLIHLQARHLRSWLNLVLVCCLFHIMAYFYFAPLGLWSIMMNMPVCLWVCLSTRITELHTIFVRVFCGCDSVLLWQQCDMLVSWMMSCFHTIGQIGRTL